MLALFVVQADPVAATPLEQVHVFELATHLVPVLDPLMPLF